ncbi:hypothetical protein LPJ64_004421 [Coemansia asiatica]|uniref:Expansin-like EG45 domain-containing protein n=1 Tax=Coemansia asiatica TaxID=1052880 RepID=A0A9W7XIC9_9FUNG|nr:hypothetical protein LPJ64_004421 [Coemansia asiatica]
MKFTTSSIAVFAVLAASAIAAPAAESSASASSSSSKVTYSGSGIVELLDPNTQGCGYDNAMYGTYFFAPNQGKFILSNGEAPECGQCIEISHGTVKPFKVQYIAPCSNCQDSLFKLSSDAMKKLSGTNDVLPSISDVKVKLVDCKGFTGTKPSSK